MIPVLEAVPNFSEGRNPETVRALVEVVEGAGARVLDHSSDPDHHRSVITCLGDPDSLAEAMVDAARVAMDRIDLRDHRGAHPRVGALDVLPFVPLAGTPMSVAVETAHVVGERLAQMGLPVCFYGHASDRAAGLSDLRRGGFEARVAGRAPGPDLPARGGVDVHPSAGVVCVGARDVLLAWNVNVRGLEASRAKEIASRIRESGGGFAGVRALALELASRGLRQISMNVEDLSATDPVEVFQAIERAVDRDGGEIVETEVIGMIPDGLVLPALKNRFRLLSANEDRLLSARVAAYLSTLPRGHRPSSPTAIETT